MNTKETPCSTPLSSLFAVVRVSDTKLILVDDVLGLHLPIFQVSLFSYWSQRCASRAKIIFIAHYI